MAISFIIFMTLIIATAIVVNKTYNKYEATISELKQENSNLNNLIKEMTEFQQFESEVNAKRWKSMTGQV